MLRLLRAVAVDERAKRILPLAFTEARTRGAPAVGAEHLLVAVAASGGVAADVLARSGVGVESIRRALDAEDERALAALGISLDEVHGRLAERFGDEALRDAPPPPDCGGLTPEAQAALDRSLREARELGDRRVAPEHLLLVLLADAGAALRLLDALGASPAEIERAVRRERLSCAG